VVEFAAVEIETAHQRAHRAVRAVHRHQRGFHFRHLRDDPAELRIRHHADQCAAPQPSCRRRLLVEHGARELDGIGTELEHFATALVCLDRGRARRKYHCGVKAGRIRYVLDQVVEHFVVVSAHILHVDEGFGTAVAVATVVIEYALAHRLDGRSLVGPTHRGHDAQPQRVSAFTEAFDRDLTRHLGDEISALVG
jgi:hypothetical protein